VPAKSALWRVGNVVWTGVSSRTLLDMAGPLPSARFVWSEGIDSGVDAGKCQKDLPLPKAQASEVLVAYKMNGSLLNQERG
jgi:DMSO/TMAO reductase YedYZ molybdopterin-dependent catalytic subunit